MTSQHADSGGPVEIRAFRGSRRRSVYREHVLPESHFERIRASAKKRGLPIVAALDFRNRHELDKRRARALAAEANALRVSAELPDLDDDLTEIAEIAHWCARASGGAWLQVDRP